MLEAPLIPQNQRPYQHPALVSDSSSPSNFYKVEADPLDQFSYGSGFALASLICLVSCTMILVARQSTVKFYNFFHFKQPHKKTLHIKPFKTISTGTPKPSTAIQLVSFAVKTYKPWTVWLLEQAMILILLIVTSSCLTIAIQCNACLSRTNTNYSFKCLNQQKYQPRDPYIGGIVVGALIFVMHALYEKVSWQRFQEYTSIFKSQPTQVKMLQQELFKSIQSDQQSAHTTTIDSATSERNGLKGLLAHQEPPPVLKKFKDLNDLVQIDEDENDEYCSPVKPRGMYASPIKRFKPNDSIRSEEHISPTKGAIQFNQLDGNESADDGDMAIRARKVDNFQDLSKSIQSIQSSQQDQKEAQTELQAESLNDKYSKQKQILKYSTVVIAVTVLLFMVMLALYNFANTSQLGLKLMFKSIGVSIATNLILSAPVFVRNYKRAASFLAQDLQKLQLINEFWQTYELKSEKLADIRDDNEAKLEEEKFGFYSLKIGLNSIHFEAQDFQKNLSITPDKTPREALRADQRSQNGSRSIFSPRSPSLGGEVVPISGSASFLGEALPSQRSKNNDNKLQYSHTKIDDQSDSSIEEIGQSPNKNFSPKQPKQMSQTKQIFSSNKKQLQFETPKPSASKVQSHRDLIPEAQLPNFNLPEAQSKHSEDLLSQMVLSSYRIEPKRVEESKLQQQPNNNLSQGMIQHSELSRSRSPLHSFKAFSQRAGEEVMNLFRNISKSSISMLSKKNSQIDKIEKIDKSELNNESKLEKIEEQYSPMWSSVKRDAKSQLVKYRNRTSVDNKIEVEDVASNPSLKELHTINQKSEEDSPQKSKRFAYADIQNADKVDGTAGRSYKKQRKFNSPNSLQKSFREANGSVERGEQLSQRESQSKIGEHTTARKRRLMMLEDAAGSSINFKNNSVGNLGSIANGTKSSINRVTGQILYQSLNSICSDLRKNESHGLLQSVQKELEKNDSQVMIGAGEVDENQETIDNLIFEAYQQNQQKPEIATKRPVISRESQKSVLVPKLAHSKSRKVEILMADSDVDTTSVKQPSALNDYQKSDKSNPISPSGQQTSAFDKLVKSSQQIIESRKNAKRSYSVNQTTGLTYNQNKVSEVLDKRKVSQAEPQTGIQKKNFNMPPNIRFSSEPTNQVDQKTANTVSALKTVSQLLAKKTQNTPVMLNKISIEEFKTQQEQRNDKHESLTRDGGRKNRPQELDNYNQISIGGQILKQGVLSRYAQRQGLQTEKENKIIVAQNFSRDRQQMKSQQPPSTRHTDERKNINSRESKKTINKDQQLFCPSESASIHQENQTEEELKYLLKISQVNQDQHFQDQRRRLEHFLTVAKHAHAKSDIQKIHQLLKELHEINKPLPSIKINELKSLEIMTSPYNQTLISMLKVENAQIRHFKELQNQQLQLKGKFQLPKNLSTDGRVQTGLNLSLGKITGVDNYDVNRFRNQRDSNTGERSASSIERAMLANAGTQILEGEGSARSYGLRQGSNASDVYQISTKFEPLQRNEYQLFVQPKTVVNQSKTEFITFDNLQVEDITNKSPASIYINY